MTHAERQTRDKEWERKARKRKAILWRLCQSSVGYRNTKSGLWKHQNNPACTKRVKGLRNAETGDCTKEEERKERGQMVRRRKRSKWPDTDRWWTDLDSYYLQHIANTLHKHQSPNAVAAGRKKKKMYPAKNTQLSTDCHVKKNI